MIYFYFLIFIFFNFSFIFFNEEFIIALNLVFFFFLIYFFFRKFIKVFFFFKIENIYFSFLYLINLYSVFIDLLVSQIQHFVFQNSNFFVLKFFYFFFFNFNYYFNLLKQSLYESFGLLKMVFNLFFFFSLSNSYFVLCNLKKHFVSPFVLELTSSLAENGVFDSFNQDEEDNNIAELEDEDDNVVIDNIFFESENEDNEFQDFSFIDFEDNEDFIDYYFSDESFEDSELENIELDFSVICCFLDISNFILYLKSQEQFYYHFL